MLDWHLHCVSRNFSYRSKRVRKKAKEMSPHNELTSYKSESHIRRGNVTSAKILLYYSI